MRMVMRQRKCPNVHGTLRKVTNAGFPEVHRGENGNTQMDLNHTRISTPGQRKPVSLGGISQRWHLSQQWKRVGLEDIWKVLSRQKEMLQMSSSIKMMVIREQEQNRTQHSTPSAPRRKKEWVPSHVETLSCTHMTQQCPLHYGTLLFTCLPPW